MFKQATLINYETATKEQLQKNIDLYDYNLKVETSKEKPDFGKLNRMQFEQAEVKTTYYEKFVHGK